MASGKASASRGRQLLQLGSAEEQSSNRYKSRISGAGIRNSSPKYYVEESGTMDVLQTRRRLPNSLDQDRDADDDTKLSTT